MSSQSKAPTPATETSVTTWACWLMAKIRAVSPLSLWVQRRSGLRRPTASPLTSTSGADPLPVTFASDQVGQVVGTLTGDVGGAAVVGAVEVVAAAVVAASWPSRAEARSPGRQRPNRPSRSIRRTRARTSRATPTPGRHRIGTESAPKGRGRVRHPAHSGRRVP